MKYVRLSTEHIEGLNDKQKEKLKSLWRIKASDVIYDLDKKEIEILPFGLEIYNARLMNVVPMMSLGEMMGHLQIKQDFTLACITNNDKKEWMLTTNNGKQYSGAEPVEILLMWMKENLLS